MNAHDTPLAADIAIVGAGAAGLMAAIAAARAGRRVVVCEQLPRPGVKLLATGGGRCNLATMLPARPFMTAFGRQGRFMHPALAAMDSQALQAFFAQLGVPTESPDGQAVFPVSQSAADVQQALWRQCRDLKVQFVFDTHAKALVLEQKLDAERPCVKGITTDQGTIAATRVIIAAGGRSYPSLGGTGGGYELARLAGHSTVPTTPALVPLVTRETWPQQLTGLSVSNVRLWIHLPRQAKAGATGDMLFTHTGISGPAILGISGDVAALLAKGNPVPICINFNSDAAALQWAAQLETWRTSKGRRTLFSLLSEAVPARLAGMICALTGTIDQRAAHLTADQRKAVVEHLTALPLTVTATEGFEKAMVTRGGVALKEIDPATLQSCLVDGLYFAGEVVDLDGPCGGFNLQWAFSSGNLAGLSAAK